MVIDVAKIVVVGLFLVDYALKKLKADAVPIFAADIQKLVVGEDRVVFEG